MKHADKVIIPKPWKKAENTDVLATFRRFGWTPPSEQKTKKV